jgi:predicted Fe-Mo cluster-binding NifX family protein
MRTRLVGAVRSGKAERMPSMRQHLNPSFRWPARQWKMPRKCRKTLLQQEAEMKICIPSLTPSGPESELSGHFGSAPFYTFYDTEKQTYEVVKNGNTSHQQGSCMPVDLLKKSNTEAVLCQGMGARAAGLLAASGIKPYLVTAETVSEAIQKFGSQDVRILNDMNACQHHSCHST